MSEYPKPNLSVNPKTNLFGMAIFKSLFRLRVTNMENARAAIDTEAGTLVVANHPTYLDPPFIIGMFNHWLQTPIATMAWEDIFKVPVVKGILRRYGAFPVNLEDPGRGPYQTMLDQLKSGGQALIFPEGERSLQELMGEWKPGALRAANKAGARVLPISVLHARRVWPMGLSTPRFFKPVELVVHPARNLEEFCPKEEGERDRIWLGRCEEAIKQIINQPIIDEDEAAKAAHLHNWKAATPTEKRGIGSDLIASRYG